MTDTTLPRAAIDWSTGAAKTRRSRRHAAEKRLRLYGLGAIAIAIGMLFILVTSLVYTGYQAFFQTMIRLPVTVSPDLVKADNIDGGNYRVIVRDAMLRAVPGVTSPADQRALIQIVSTDAPFVIRNMVSKDPRLIGQTFDITIPASDPFDQLNKGIIPRDVPEDQRRVNDKQIGWFDQMVAKGMITKPFNWGLFFNADSRFPEQAGLAGAIVGSFYALLVCFLISFPMAIAAAIYLEEFAPKNRWTEVI